jgi:ArsR family transcriptional regulator
MLMKMIEFYCDYSMITTVIKVTWDKVHIVLDTTFLGNIIQYMLNYISDKIHPSPVNLEILAERLKVLAEPKRLLILELIIQGRQCNCELGDALQMAPNLISHHLSKLRKVGLVHAERDPLDSRWIYYSVNRTALDELNATFGAFFDQARIQPRHLTCGPSAVVCQSDGTISPPSKSLSEKKRS